ncbi:HAD family hydrolase [Demetria terragena]|uniref:HAD family hydrolase n=1 Tax=Demetria terragena TaxID=63959 RepID=UPI0003680D35|nr:HAD family hydrolase [Demetria terragena]
MVERPRLVATDLDGTLLATDGSVSPRTAAAWRRLGELGIESVLVTARPPRWIDPLRDIVGTHGLAICTNGAFTYDVGQCAVVDERGMPRSVVLEVAALLRDRFPDVGFAVECADGMYREPGYPDPHAEHLPDMPFQPIEELADHLVVGKLLAARPGEPDPEFVSVVTELIAGRAEVAFSGVGALAEISAPGVTKGVALQSWCDERGVAAQDVWAFGDMPNDLPMLAWAGRSYAVANAHPEVLAAATHQCPSNDDDGVARILESLVPPSGRTSGE